MELYCQEPVERHQAPALVLENETDHQSRDQFAVVIGAEDMTPEASSQIVHAPNAEVCTTSTQAGSCSAGTTAVADEHLQNTSGRAVRSRIHNGYARVRSKSAPGVFETFLQRKRQPTDTAQSSLLYSSTDRVYARQYRCAVPGCGYLKTFTWKNLRRHLVQQHPAETGVDAADYTCPVVGCQSSNKTWLRTYRLRDHIMRSHPDLDVHEQVRSHVLRLSRTSILTDTFHLTSNALLPKRLDQTLNKDTGNDEVFDHTDKAPVRPLSSSFVLYKHDSYDHVSRVDSDHRTHSHCGEGGNDGSYPQNQNMAGEYVPYICDEPSMSQPSIQGEVQRISSDPSAKGSESLLEATGPLSATRIQAIPGIRADSLMGIYQVSETIQTDHCAVKIQGLDSHKSSSDSNPPLVNPRPLALRQNDIQEKINDVAKVFPGPARPDTFPYGSNIPELTVRSKTAPPYVMGKLKSHVRRRYSFVNSSLSIDPQDGTIAAQDVDTSKRSTNSGPSNLRLPSTTTANKQPQKRRRKDSEDLDEAGDVSGGAGREVTHDADSEKFRCVHCGCGCPKARLTGENGEPHEWCEKSHEFMSQLKRHHEHVHNFHYCTRCFSQFNDSQEEQEHRKARSCTPKCVTSGCPNEGSAFLCRKQSRGGERPCTHGTIKYPNEPEEQWNELSRMAHERREAPDLAETRPVTNEEAHTSSMNELPFSMLCTAATLKPRVVDLKALLDPMWKCLIDPKDMSNASHETLHGFYRQYLALPNISSLPSRSGSELCESYLEFRRLEDLVKMIWQAIEHGAPLTVGDFRLYRTKVIEFLGEEGLGARTITPSNDLTGASYTSMNPGQSSSGFTNIPLGRPELASLDPAHSLDFPHGEFDSHSGLDSMEFGSYNFDEPNEDNHTQPGITQNSTAFDMLPINTTTTQGPPGFLWAGEHGAERSTSNAPIFMPVGEITTASDQLNGSESQPVSTRSKGKGRARDSGYHSL